MLITRKSLLSGIVRTLDLPVTKEQDWEGGTLIHRAMPHLSANEREFIISGATQEEWEEAFGGEEY